MGPTATGKLVIVKTREVKARVDGVVDGAKTTRTDDTKEQSWENIFRGSKFATTEWIWNTLALCLKMTLSLCSWKMMMLKGKT